MKLFLLLTLVAIPTWATTIHCNTNSGDVSLIQAGVTAGGTLNLSGTCTATSGTVNLNNAVSIVAAAGTVINGSNNQVFLLSHDNVHITGLTINAGYIGANIPSGLQWHDFQFNGNIIQNLTNGGTLNCYPNCGGPAAINFAGLGLVSSSISNNQFLNIWGQGWPTDPTTTTGAKAGQPCYEGTPPGACYMDVPTNNGAWGAQGITIDSIDQTLVNNNIFDKIGNDGMHIDFIITTGNTGPHGTTTGNQIKFNQFAHIHRIPMEIQSQPSSTCPGGCNYGIVNTTGMQISGNYTHDYAWPYLQTWGASLVPDGSKLGVDLNNTFVSNLGAGPGSLAMASCFELSLDNGTMQGNYCLTTTANQGFGQVISQGTSSSSSFTILEQNNIFCGNSHMNSFGTEGPGPFATVTRQFNYTNTSTCPASPNLTTSGMTSTFTSANNQSFPSGGNGTWSFNVVSNLSIRQVQFFVDGSTTPTVTQELQDQNTNFSSDRKLLYHATFSTTALSIGSHTIQAVATDVSGITTGGIQSQNFTKGGSGGTPLVSLSATTLTFTPQVVASTSAAQVDTLTNTGGATLNITSIVTTGDFANTTTCGSTLAASASCNISVTFTPTTTGSRSGAVTLTTNAASSPNVVALTGTGTSGGSGCIASPPNLIPAGECDGSTYPTGFGFSPGGSSSTAAQSNTGPSGSSAIRVTTIGTPVNMELTNDNNTVAANSPYVYSAVIQSSRTQNIHILLIKQSSPFTGYGLDITVSVGPGFTTINQPFTTNGSPTAGTARLTHQLPNAQNGDTFDITDLGIVPGMGSAPIASFSLTSLMFNAQVVSTTSAAQTVVLTNTGNALMNISSIVTTGNFANTTSCGATLAATASCNISVTFMPTASGTRTGAVTITDDAAGSPQVISLSGTGTSGSQSCRIWLPPREGEWIRKVA